MMKKILCILAAGVLAGSAIGAETDQAKAAVETMVDEVLTTLALPDASSSAKLDEIIQIITPVFDFPLMAKLTLGRSGWPKLSAGQQEEFTDLFVEKLRKVYAKQVEGFSGQSVVFEQAVEAGGKVQVSSYILSKGDRISILYKLYKKGDAWRIYDIEIQDVSIVSSYRAQFVPVIQDRSPEALIQDLRESISTAKTNQG